MLVSETLLGDNDAYCELVSRCKSIVFAAIGAVISEPYTAEDIAQDTFLDGYIQLSRLRDPAKFPPWICGIARRKVLHYVTRRRTCECLEDFADTLPAENASPEDRLLQKEKDRAVQKAVRQLSDKNRRAAELFYFENMSVAEIALRLSLSEGTVKSRLYEARTKLKGVLYDMDSEFEENIREKLRQLRVYYRLGGKGNPDYARAYKETESMIAKLPDSTEKQSAMASLYAEKHFIEDAGTDMLEKVKETARSGGNGSVLAGLYIEEIVCDDNFTGQIERIDREAIPEMEKLHSDDGKGCLLVWRGVANMYLRNYAEARKDWEQAERLCYRSNIYHALACSALRTMEKEKQHAQNPYESFQISAEGWAKHGTKTLLYSQPGARPGRITMYKKHRMSNVTYFSSCFDGIFFDTAMEVGRPYKSKAGDATLTVEGYQEYVSVAAGQFDNCMLIHYSAPSDYDARIWYARNTGLVKVIFSGALPEEETYELVAYEIKGGEGWLPFCRGNRWKYKKTDLPDYLYQCFENEIDWTDGRTANVITINTVSFRKNDLTAFESDSDVCMEKAEELSSHWKLEDAIDMLKRAVRENTSQQAVLGALNGIEFLTRFSEYQKKEYRFCPSSCCTRSLTVGDGRILYDENDIYDISPYRFGTRHAENRIFGVKAFRYLQILTGCIWNDKWIPGYQDCKKTAPFPEEDPIAVNISVEEAGALSVKSGVFLNCIKLTLSAEKPELGENYYFRDFDYIWCGTKEFWFAPGVGLVKFDFTWGTDLKSSCELAAYSLPAADSNSYMPVCIGNRWEYDEINLTAEGYRAKRILGIPGGIGSRYLLNDNQEFLYLGTEKEYEEFKKTEIMPRH